MSNRRKIIERIRGLLALANPGSGATEAEAMSAAEKAAELMQKYAVDRQEAEGTAEEFEEAVRFAATQREKELQFTLIWPVARFCGAIAFMPKNSTRTYVLWGPTSAVVFAEWLMDMLEEFVERGTYSYLMDQRKDCRWQDDLFGHYDRKAMKAKVASEAAGWAYREAATKRIAARLWKIVQARPDEERQHRALIDDLRRNRGITLSEGASIKKRFYADNAASRAGRERGGAATFNRPVAGTQIKMIAAK